MALNSLFCADVPLSNYSFTHFVLSAVRHFWFCLISSFIFFAAMSCSFCSRLFLKGDAVIFFDFVDLFRFYHVDLPFLGTAEFGMESREWKGGRRSSRKWQIRRNSISLTWSWTSGDGQWFFRWIHYSSAVCILRWIIQSYCYSSLAMNTVISCAVMIIITRSFRC